MAVAVAVRRGLVHPRFRPHQTVCRGVLVVTDSAVP
eukprot:CAMPEP_0175103466 /NCGR_PEP_ID=MMETSP0086_2-20121207/9104_1 /TAXON_ID=136419 /ORGANISM="Unknown Unknown, Strain D1" /LENGTH=35 /DNA_ID= /DNA_START= /DNA_END= /DNA_ORIENTATION=